MLTVFGYSIPLPPELQFLGNTVGSFLATVIIWVIIALALYATFGYPLRWLAHLFPGEIDDIILGIVRKPLLILTVAFGAVNSLGVLDLPPPVTIVLERLFNTILILAVAYLLWRVLRDVIIYYGEPAAKQTESRLDDILIPVVNLFGSLVVILTAALLIFPLWGIDITSVLLGAGVVGLILGLALQDTLANVFGSINLLADAPFRTGDLIVLPDGRICQVLRIGLRMTQLFHLDEHATVYIPNKALSSATIVNITKPTVEAKVSIPVGIAYQVNFAHVASILREIALGHPNVLASDLSKKFPLVEDKIKRLRSRARRLAKTNPLRGKLLGQADRYQQALVKLQKENELNNQIIALCQGLQQLVQGIQGREAGGLTRAEIADLHTTYLLPLDEQVQRVSRALKAWNNMPDPWISAEEQVAERVRWEAQNQRLNAKWEALKRAIARPKTETEMRLDDMTKGFAHWLTTDYKIIAEDWKDPKVAFKGFADSRIHMQVDFYVDDIRLEHCDRKRRVMTEIAQEIHERFQHEGLVS